MRSRRLLVLLAALGSWSIGPGATGMSGATDPTVPTPLVVPAGTRLIARLNTTIGTTHSVGPDRIADATHAGDAWAATVTRPVGDAQGRLAIPEGAIVHGHVVALAAGRGVRLPRLELSAERLDGHAIDAHVVGADVQRLESVDLGKTADSAAFAGVLLGGIAFGVPGVMIGYGFGGGNAAVGAVRERRVEAWLSAGADLALELDQPLTIER